MPQVVEPHAARCAGDAVRALLLVGEPGPQDLLIEPGCADRLLRPGHRAQPLLVKISDEPEHAWIARQGKQILDAAEQPQPVVGAFLVTVVAAHEVSADLRGREVLDGEDPPVGHRAHPLAEGGEHLLVRFEVLRPAGHDDLRLALGRSQQCLKVISGPLVGDSGDQLVEAVE